VEIAPEMSSHLEKLRDGLLAVIELRGLYLYGSLTTGDFSPASSDIDVLAITDRRPDAAVLDRLRALHLDLARAGGPYARLNCLYVADGTLADQGRLQPYWYGDRMKQWRVKIMTVAELGHAGQVLHGSWPPPGLPDVSLAELREHALGELTGYWRRRTYWPGIWLHDRWVDFALVTLARTAAVMHDGVLITKSQAIAELAAFGAPPGLIDPVGRRRAGEQVRVTVVQRLVRAARTRHIMATGIRHLTAT
jgi:predicted nucleotidyltransferase